MYKTILRSFLIATAVFGMAGSAMAYPSLQPTQHGIALPSASALIDSEPALAPFAFVKFCLARREQCTDSNPIRSITLGAKDWDELQQVNRQINDAIAPDAAKGALDWSLDTRLGNCNDYAVQKRDALIKMGYPMGALSLAVVLTPFGEGHLVLTVRTDRGDFVLDNRRSTITAWNRTGYRWVKRQSAEDPQLWVALSMAPQGRSPASIAAAKASVPQGKSAAAEAAASPEAAPQHAIALDWAARPTMWLPGMSGAEPPLGEPGQIGLTISHAAAGRETGMLALDSLGYWKVGPDAVAG